MITRTQYVGTYDNIHRLRHPNYRAADDKKINDCFRILSSDRLQPRKYVIENDLMIIVNIWSLKVSYNTFVILVEN